MKSDTIIRMHTEEGFRNLALEIFRFQSENSLVYKEYLNKIGCNPDSIKELEQIPFLPINFFKNKEIVSNSSKPKLVFYSSGTTHHQRSLHYLTHPSWYVHSFSSGFEFFFGNIKEYTILALLPSYLDQKNSSLVYMFKKLIDDANNPESGFYLNDNKTLINKLEELDLSGKKILFIGVSYALLDVLEKRQFSLKNTIVMETGGMKGRRKELIKSELHNILKKGFGVKTIYSEYGMTELLSQAYSKGDGIYNPVPWMKILVREIEDPFEILSYEKTGGINIIDLANYHSCSFVETMDLGKRFADGSFEILGRFDHSDIRGCNLMVE